MLKIGLTGGIGCGKSTVTNLFASLGAPIIDADQISHDLVAPGQAALLSVQRQFGEDIIKHDGGLDREKLRNIVFSDKTAKQRLEAILHPMVRLAIQTKLAELDAVYCIVSIPLLFETGMAELADRVLVVDCPVEMQMARVKGRDNLSEERVKSIIDSQVSRNFRIYHADDLIDNTGSADRLAEQVKKLHNLYIYLSHQQD